MPIASWAPSRSQHQHVVLEVRARRIAPRVAPALLGVDAHLALHPPVHASAMPSVAAIAMPCAKYCSEYSSAACSAST